MIASDCFFAGSFYGDIGAFAGGRYEVSAVPVKSCAD